MERIVIPGKATYTPLQLTDMALAGPIVSRLLLGASFPGQLVAAGSAGYYAGSAARDWYARRDVRPIEFLEAFGADVFDLEEQPEEARLWEIKLLGHALNDGYTAREPEISELAEQTNEHLTAYIAAITGQEIVTSSEVRTIGLARFLVPGALGACDPISGDISIFDTVGPLTPHVIAHELCHRKGYLKELHAQALSYLSNRNSGDPVLVQAARFERLHRQLRVHQRKSATRIAPRELVRLPVLRAELADAMLPFLPEYEDAKKRTFSSRLYNKRMQLTGQNGITDYDEGFVRFLWTFRRSETASVSRSHTDV